MIHVVRATSPEVRAHLSVAASSLMQAAAGLLATHTDGPSDVARRSRRSTSTTASGWDEDQ